MVGLDWRRWQRAWRKWRRLSTEERWLVASALRLWPECKLILRRRGLQAAQERMFRKKPVAGRAGAGAAIEPKRVARLVDTLFRRLPGDATCLERSLITASLLHARGFEPQIQIGVRKGIEGMEFHAWVTIGEDVVNDSERVTGYERLASAGPGAGT